MFWLIANDVVDFVSSKTTSEVVARGTLLLSLSIFVDGFKIAGSRPCCKAPHIV